MTSSTESESQTDLKYAGFWLRVHASLIDYFLVAVITFIVAWVFNQNILHDLENEGVREQGRFWATEISHNLIGFFIWYLYYTVAESSKFQGTLGKRLLDLKVIDESGNRISVARAAGRLISKIVSAIIFLIGFLMVGWTQKKQGLHDKIANTFVIIDR